MLNAQFRKSLDDFGEKWIGDFRDDQTKNTTAAANKRSCMSVWIIAYLINHPPHSSGKNRIHRWNAIDSSRNSRSRNLCPRRNFLYGHSRTKSGNYSYRYRHRSSRMYTDSGEWRSESEARWLEDRSTRDGRGVRSLMRRLERFNLKRVKTR